MDFDKELLKKEALRVINLLKKDFVFDDGSFFLEKDKNGIFPYHIYPDIGDYLIFFLYFGEDEFINKHIKLLKDKMGQSYTLISEFPTFSVSNLAKSYEYTDLLVGLFDYYIYKKDDESKELLIGATNRAIELFSLDKKITSFYHSSTKFHIPIIDTRDSTLIEVFVDLYKEFGDKKYLEVSNNIFEILIGSDFFIKNNILSNFDASLFLKKAFSLIRSTKFEEVDVCKNNTNSLFAFLALYKVTSNLKIKDAIDTILDTILNEASFDGGISKRFNKGKKPESANLTSSFPVIDFLCDLYFETKDYKYLEKAKKIADFWISKQGKTGLFSLESDKKESFFDSETDMTISLLKLHDLSKEEKYLESAEKCFKGILKYHGRNDYVLGIDIESGEVKNSIQRTKFMALYLKLIILIINIDNESMYNKDWLISLLRDR